MEKMQTGEPKLLIKFPTRGRPRQFFNVLTLYYQYMQGKNFEFVISCDTDDETMNNDVVKEHFKGFPNLTVNYSDNKTKVEAINANMEDRDFDILLLASDDMVPEMYGYDRIIKQAMLSCYSDYDGVLWFFDGWRKDLNTLCILGKKYYDRFGFIYNPAYKTWFCDNEFTKVATLLGKQTYSEHVIIRHCHPDIIGSGHDETYNRNNNQEEMKQDQQTLESRLKKNFDIPDSEIKAQSNE